MYPQPPQNPQGPQYPPQPQGQNPQGPYPPQQPGWQPAPKATGRPLLVVVVVLAVLAVVLVASLVFVLVTKKDNVAKPSGSPTASVTQTEGGKTPTKAPTTSSSTPVTKPPTESNEAPNIANSEAFVSYESEASGLEYAEHVTLGPGEPDARIVFSTDGVLRDFRVLALEYAESGGDGNGVGGVNFTTQVVHRAGDLHTMHPLLVDVTFFGTIPNNGISYVDHTGKTRYFAVQESGKDGSLSLMEF
ncbi:MAG: hypothetical protein Q4G30_00485 [Actinomycetaceae bacterium]|nr:hypothetical protein [Actinomycetaceae bacterium]